MKEATVACDICKSLHKEKDAGATWAWVDGKIVCLNRNHHGVDGLIDKEFWEKERKKIAEAERKES